MDRIPSWVWYAVGAVIFIIAFLYIRASAATTQPTTGQASNIISLPSPNDLGNYNGSADILAQMLATNHQLIADLSNSSGQPKAK